MIVHVVTSKVEEDMEVAEGSTSLEVLGKLRLLPDAHLVLKGRTPIPIDAPLADGDAIRIIKVASGG